MRILHVRLAVLQLIFTVGIVREPAAKTQDSFASQFPPIAPSTDETSRRDYLDGIKLLKHKDPELRALGARMLAGLGDNASPAIPELIALLGDGHVAERDEPMFSRSVGQVASLSFESIGPKAVPRARHAMVTRPEKAIRIAAASTLVELLHKSGQTRRSSYRCWIGRQRIPKKPCGGSRCKAWEGWDPWPSRLLLISSKSSRATLRNGSDSKP